MSLYDLQKRPTSITAKDKYQFYNSLAKKTKNLPVMLSSKRYLISLTFEP